LIKLSASIVETDLELARAVLKRDRKASAEFVQLYSDPVYRYIKFRMQPRIEPVEDLVQEVFLTAWKSLGKYQGTSPLRVWILGIARHKVQDYYRQVLRNMPFPEDAEDLKANDVPMESLLNQRQAEGWIAEILARLPEDDRTALLWRYWEKRSAEEIGTEIGRTAKAVERLLARAREKFKMEWQRKEAGQ